MPTIQCLLLALLCMPVMFLFIFLHSFTANSTHRVGSCIFVWRAGLVVKQCRAYDDLGVNFDNTPTTHTTDVAAEHYLVPGIDYS